MSLATQRRRCSCRAAKFVLLGYAFVGLVDILDPILEHGTFSRQKMGDLIEARCALTAKVGYQLADLKLLAAREGLRWSLSRQHSSAPVSVSDPRYFS